MSGCMWLSWIVEKWYLEQRGETLWHKANNGSRRWQALNGGEGGVLTVLLLSLFTAYDLQSSV